MLWLLNEKYRSQNRPDKTFIKWKMKQTSIIFAGGCMSTPSKVSNMIKYMYSGMLMVHSPAGDCGVKRGQIQTPWCTV